MVPAPVIALPGAYGTMMMFGLATSAIISTVPTNTLVVRAFKSDIPFINITSLGRNNFTDEQSLSYYDSDDASNDDDDYINTYQFPGQFELEQKHDVVGWSDDRHSNIDELILLRTGTPVMPAGIDADLVKEVLSQQQRTFELLDAVTQKLATLSINNKVKERRSLLDEDRRYRESINTISAYPSVVNASRNLTMRVESTSSRHDNDDFELAEHDARPTMLRQSDTRHLLHSPPKLFNATDAYHSKLNKTNLEKISSLLQEAMELQRGGMSADLVRRDFSKVGSLLTKAVLKVLEYAIRGLRDDEPKLTCTQITRALDKVFIYASAIEYGADFYPEQFHSMSKRFRTKHPKINKLYQNTIKQCIEKKKEVARQMEFESDASAITGIANPDDYWIQDDISIASSLENDHEHDKRDLSTVGSQIVFFNGSIHKASIRRRDAIESNPEHSTMYLHVNSETFTIGLLLFLACLFCIWFRQFCTSRRSKRQQPMMSEYECPRDVRAVHWDRESGFVDDSE